MILVELFSRDNCRLCDVAEKVLMEAKQRQPFELKVVKIHEGDEYFENMKERVPVVHINKEFAFQYRVDKHELAQKLSSIAGQ